MKHRQGQHLHDMRELTYKEKKLDSFIAHFGGRFPEGSKPSKYEIRQLLEHRHNLRDQLKAPTLKYSDLYKISDSNLMHKLSGALEFFGGNRAAFIATNQGAMAVPYSPSRTLGHHMPLIQITPKVLWETRPHWLCAVPPCPWLWTGNNLQSSWWQHWCDVGSHYTLFN